MLKWLIDDSTLGIVFKPKRSQNLFQRISSIKDLIQLALETGRCAFLMDDTSVGSTYPAEAALIADLCVGILSGATAAFEARLAGVPSVLLDVDGFSCHPFYTWGQGRVVFNNWESLCSAIEQYRVAPESHPEFGDWSPGLCDLDPYQDGQASLRLGSYILWVFEALKQRESKMSALKTASAKFESCWGKRHISPGI